MGAQDWQSRPPKFQGLTSAATVSIDTRIAPFFKVGPASDITFNATDAGKPGEQLVLFIDTIDTNTRTLTFGTNFRSTGTLATGATAARRFIVVFLSDGLVWTEQSRTAAQA